MHKRLWACLALYMLKLQSHNLVHSLELINLEPTVNMVEKFKHHWDLIKIKWN